MTNKLKSFTLLETLIVMVVMVVVIASVFSVFLLVTSHFNKFQSKKNASTDFVFFDKIFDQEVFQADSLTLTETQGINIYIRERKIHYQILDSSIVRFEALADTFHIAVENKRIELVDPSSLLINKIVLNVIVNDDVISPSYTKRYAADTYLKYAIRN
jgi:hypothetical protein